VSHSTADTDHTAYGGGHEDGQTDHSNVAGARSMPRQASRMWPVVPRGPCSDSVRPPGRAPLTYPACPHPWRDPLQPSRTGASSTGSAPACWWPRGKTDSSAWPRSVVCRCCTSATTSFRTVARRAPSSSPSSGQHCPPVLQELVRAGPENARKAAYRIVSPQLADVCSPVAASLRRSRRRLLWMEA